MSDFLPPVVMELRAKATQLFATIGEVNAETDKMVSSTEKGSVRMQTAYKSAASAGKVLALGIGGAAVVIGGYSIKAAMAAQVTDAKLSVAIKNAGGSYLALKPKIDAVDASNRKLGESNDDTNQALATLTTALHSPAKALADMAIAANLARAKNIDLNTAAMLVAKTSEGQSRGLKQLGIDLPTVAGGAAKLAVAQQTVAADQAKVNSILAATPTAANSASKAHKAYEAAILAVTTAQAKATAIGSAGSQMLAALSQRVKGAASAFGDTLAGKVKAAQAGLENIAETIGSKLIPVVLKVITAAQAMGKWLSQNQGVARALGVTIASVAGILIAAYVAQKAYTAGLAAVRVATIAANVVAGIFGITTKANTAASYGQEGATYASAAAQKAYAVGAGIATVATKIGSAATKAWTGIQKAFTVAQYLSKASVLEYVAATVAAKVASIAGAAATGIATAAQWLFNAAMDANPIGLIILAVAALIAGIILLVTHWKQVTDFLSSVWKDVSAFVISTVKDIGNWFNSVFGAIGTFVSNAFKGAANIIIGFFNFVTDAINTVIGGLDQAAAGIKNITGGAINFSIGKLPHIPSFDVGGTIPGPTGAPILTVHHGGEETLSIDMLTGRQPISDRVVNAVSAQSAAGRSGTSGGPTHVDNSRHVTVQVQTNATPERIASSVGWKLRQKG
jgi:hypothetical protein